MEGFQHVPTTSLCPWNNGHIIIISISISIIIITTTIIITLYHPPSIHHPSFIIHHPSSIIPHSSFIIHYHVPIISPIPFPMFILTCLSHASWHLDQCIHEFHPPPGRGYAVRSQSLSARMCSKLSSIFLRSPASLNLGARPLDGLNLGAIWDIISIIICIYIYSIIWL